MKEKNMPKYTAESINHGSKNVARFFFATRLSKNEEKWKDINKIFQKLKKNGVAAFFLANLWGKIEKHVRKRMSMLNKRGKVVR